MPLRPYRRLLRLPGVTPLVLVALVARIPHAMTGVVLTLHVVGRLHLGYGRAGLVAGAMTVGMAIGAPWRGRRVDRLGLRRALLPSVLVESAVWVVAPRLGYAALLAAVFVAGLFLVPVFSVVRQSLAALVPPAQQRTAFALDSVATELTFMLAPAVGVLLATRASSTVALTVVGVSTVAAGLLLMWFDPPTTSRWTADADPEVEAASRGDVSAPRGRARELLTTPGVLVVFAAGAAAALILNGTDVSIVAALRGSGHQGSVGWMIALWCLGSVVGGLAYGSGRREVHPLVLVALLGAFTLPAALATSQAQLATALVVAGLPCAASLSAINASLVRSVPEDRRGEVMGWSGTANTVGAALGAPLGGLVIDRLGPQAGFLAAGTVGLLLTLGGLAVLHVVRPSSALLGPGTPVDPAVPARTAPAVTTDGDLADEAADDGQPAAAPAAAVAGQAAPG